MTFSQVAIGAAFVSDGESYRKASETKAHRLSNPREGAGPVRFRAEQVVDEPPNEQAILQAAKAEQAKREAAAEKKSKPHS